MTALAVAGVVLSPPWRRGRVEPWTAAAAAAVFAFYAAPVVLSGAATFTGYVKLDDTATWLALTDRVMEHGRDLTGLAPSSYEAALETPTTPMAIRSGPSCRWELVTSFSALTPPGSISRA